jgi:hypothetical protein
VVVNAVGRGTCAACRAEARAEQREMAALRRRLPRAIRTALTPAELPPPHGPKALRAWQTQWRM